VIDAHSQELIGSQNKKEMVGSVYFPERNGRNGTTGTAETVGQLQI